MKLLPFILVLVFFSSSSAKSVAEFEGCSNCTIQVYFPKPWCVEAWNAKWQVTYDYLLKITNNVHDVVLKTEDKCSPISGYYIVEMTYNDTNKKEFKVLPVGGGE